MGYLIFSITFIILSVWIGISIVWWTLKNGISPMPSSRKVSKAILSIIPSNQTGILLELGSGWGSLAAAIAKEHINCRIIGYETSLVPLWISKLFSGSIGLKNIDFLRKDIYEVPLQEASVVVCYLFPKAMDKLRPKFEKELPRGTLVISNTFAVPGWKPIQIIQIQDLYRTKIYVYKT